MANSVQVLDWLFENKLRAYPLQEQINRVSDNTYVLSDRVILDAQFVFNGTTSSVSLNSIVVAGNSVTFNLSSGITFVADKSQDVPQYLRLSSGHLLVVGDGILTLTDGTYNFTGVNFEPALIHEFSGPWRGVTSLAFDPHSSLTGEIDLFEGIQFEVRLDGQNLILGTNNYYGIPANCDHYGTRANDCDDIISSINGVSPDGNNELKILAGPGIVVWDNPADHQIFVGFTFTSVDDICKTVPLPPSPL